MWQHYLQPVRLDEALQALREHAGNARIVAGGTDVLVELQRGIRATPTLIDITRLPGLKYVRHEDGWIHLGALATHNDVVASPECARYALPLAQACWEVGAPQIRARATVAGNLITASPANDTIAPLMALGADVVLASVEGERVVPLRDFFPGFRQTVLKPHELLREIRFPALSERQRGLFLKLGLRRAQAISVIDIAMVLTFESDAPAGRISDAAVALGCLAPTVVRARTAETFLAGQRLVPEVCREAGQLACHDASPIDDVRGSAGYRRATLAALVAHGLQRIAEGREADGWPDRPVLLETSVNSAAPPEPFDGVIKTTINGRPYELAGAQRMSLLNALRDVAGLTGAKEGCAEGECGACTVWLNGQAVMACLAPAPQAHGAAITTIEGLERDGRLHPLQQAFIEHAAVQCGFCIPGFLMAGSKLLEEVGLPDLDQARVALSGNICRCTGYRKILEAVLDASRSFEF